MTHGPDEEAPIRILQVISSSERRGAQVFGADLHEALAARGHEVRTVALVAGAAGGFDIPVLGRTWVGAVPRLRGEMSWADVTIGHGSRTLPACAAASVGAATPWVYRSIGDPLFWANTPPRRLRVRAFLRRASGVVALWDGAADDLRSLGAGTDHLRVIPNGVPAARCPRVRPGRRDPARGQLGLRREVPTVAFVGALSTEKNVGAAVDAVARIPGCQLVVAGDGPERGRLERHAAHVLPGRAWFLGSIPSPTPVFEAADCVVLPSRSEGLPGVLIEAGLVGLGAVASRVGGVAEVVLPGRTGELVRPGCVDELVIALRLVLRRGEDYGAAARDHCLRRFEIGVVADAWSAFLCDVLASSNGDPSGDVCGRGSPATPGTRGL